MNYRDLIKNYFALNNSFKQRLTFHLGAEAGFFSEMNNMILAIIFCLDREIKFTLYSKRGNFSYSEGWNDFFLPFCDQKDLFLHSRYNRRSNQMKNSKKLPPYFLKILSGNDFLTQDIWYSFRNQDFSNKLFTIPQLGLENAALLDTTKVIISMIWKYQPHAKKLIDNFKTSIVLPKKYISIHIRSGDKNLETETYKIEKYMEKASSIGLSKNVFILTDDYSIIENLIIKYSEWNFLTLCDPSERGYQHSDFKKKSKHEKYLKHLKLLASIDICAEANHFIGTYSSNPGMFMGMRIGEENCSCLDFDSWVIW